MSGEVIMLPAVDLDDTFPLIKAINERRSKRNYAPYELTGDELSLLLWSAGGITDDVRGFRASPSAGAIYPFTVYVVTGDGVHRYVPANHSLLLHKEGDLRVKLSTVSLGQRALAEASAVFVLVYHGTNLVSRYKDRAFRYACMEAGHIAQNILLTTVKLGLGAVAVGAFHGEFVNDLLNIKDDALYMVAVGKPK